jgi:hypothetical protein
MKGIFQYPIEMQDGILFHFVHTISSFYDI